MRNKDYLGNTSENVFLFEMCTTSAKKQKLVHSPFINIHYYVSNMIQGSKLFYGSSTCCVYQMESIQWWFKVFTRSQPIPVG